jgi:hypothetical protein
MQTGTEKHLDVRSMKFSFAAIWSLVKDYTDLVLGSSLVISYLLPSIIVAHGFTIPSFSVELMHFLLICHCSSLEASPYNFRALVSRNQ